MSSIFERTVMMAKCDADLMIKKGVISLKHYMTIDRDVCTLHFLHASEAESFLKEVNAFKEFLQDSLSVVGANDVIERGYVGEHYLIDSDSVDAWKSFYSL